MLEKKSTPCRDLNQRSSSAIMYPMLTKYQLYTTSVLYRCEKAGCSLVVDDNDENDDDDDDDDEGEG